jgi:hypothetical protein
LNVITHGSYSNYNALVTTWQKQRGPITFQANYTYSRVLGIRDGQSDNANGNGTNVDAFNLRNNYGPLAVDRTNIFNASYIFHIPGITHKNRLIEGVTNGWELSDITQLHSDPSLQPNTNGNLNAGFPNGVSNQSILGTDSQTLVPTIICNIACKKYFDPACFRVPTIGQNGPAIWPNIKGPAFFNTDLGVYKNVSLRDHQTVQVRFTAFNFLNHPLPQFGLGGRM